MGEMPGRTEMDGAVYESTLPWDPDRPDTVIISCVDGRWFRHFEEFARVHVKAGSRTDYLAVPGGIEPMTLFDLVPKDFNFFRRRIEGLVAAHGTKRIVAIAHQDCAWYRTHKLGPLRLDMRDRQIRDLLRSAERLREMFPGIVVETYYARLSGTSPERVVFDTV
jgi:carbonic anhydrase-like protein